MSIKQKEAKFNIMFTDLLVWVDNSPFFKCCKSTSKSNDKSESKKLTEESDYSLMQSLMEDMDTGGSDFKEIRDSGIESLHNKISDPVVKKFLKRRFTNETSKDRHPNGIPILKNIQGTIYSEEMVAILGPSGSGKTTLLNYISSRSNWNPDLLVDGDLYLNGSKVKNLSKYKHLIGFVPQEDIYIEGSTVRENLETYGRLRGFPDYRERADIVIKDLHLEKCQNTKMGDGEDRGVSGGERKRACIGIELMSDPKILFMDEPTTGIDSFTALEVIKNIKKLNENKGLGVITVIHQPRQEIVDNFDRVSVFY